MSALYTMQYQGVAGFGGGVVYIGRGKILGMDITQAHYVGSYTEQGGHIRGTVTITAAGALVAGQPIPTGGQVQATFDWPINFADGQYLPVAVGGKPVQVVLRKIGDVP
jgi:hypothetical protein